jgi:hypothetical protein
MALTWSRERRWDGFRPKSQNFAYPEDIPQFPDDDERRAGGALKMTLQRKHVLYYII